MRHVRLWTGVFGRGFLFVFVACAISLPAALVSYMSGDQREFPTYSSPHASLAAYVVEIGGTMIVAFFLWRLCVRLRGRGVWS